MTDQNLKIIDEAVRRASGIEGWMHETELRWLAIMARHAPIIIEVGSWKGRSSKALAFSTPGVLYCVDHWKGATDPNDATSVEAREKGSEIINLIFQSSLAEEMKAKKVFPIWADREEAVKKLEKILFGAKADMIFIDGDHSYESAKADILAFRPFLKEGGVLCGHDYAGIFPGVVKAVDELVPEATHPAGSLWTKQIFMKA